MLVAVGLSQVQVIIIPPLQVSIMMEQRGIIIMFIAGAAGIMAGIVGIPIIGRSVVIILIYI
jgi:hypothetical protein